MYVEGGVYKLHGHALGGSTYSDSHHVPDLICLQEAGEDDVCADSLLQT